MADEVEYLSQGVNYLGFLQTQLRDLQGIATLAYELIQNADDVHTEDGQPGASRITFDVRDDALVVENDGIFRQRDFDRIRDIASGGKREEQGTTGAFGIGFISVYQITDAPEIFSSGVHYRIRPDRQEDHRIEVRKVDVAGTRFRLPWALEPNSAVREKLKLAAVDLSQLDEFESEIGNALSFGSLFLKQLKTLELKRNGKSVKTIRREMLEDDQLLVDENNQTTYWKILQGNFETEAKQLRSRFPHIEEKRRSQVQIAISDSLIEGRLFAVLPSQTTSGLPFHINADFYPTADRKRIIFEKDYQSDWNRAAIWCAAQVLSKHFDKLKDSLGYKAFWDLLEKIHACRSDWVFGKFWEVLSPSYHEREIVYSSSKGWHRPARIHYLDSDAERNASEIFEGLGIAVVHPDLRDKRGLLTTKDFRIGVPFLELDHVIAALANASLNKPTALAEAPEPLRTYKNWRLLWEVLEELVKSRPGRQSPEKSIPQLIRYAIAPGLDGQLWPPEFLRRSNDTATRALFPKVRWLDASHLADLTQIQKLIAEFTPSDAIASLKQTDPVEIEQAWRSGQFTLEQLYDWFLACRDRWRYNLALIENIRLLPIWPAGNGLRSLEGLFIPGDFRDDPLKLTQLINVSVLGGRTDLLVDLEVKTLDFKEYLRELSENFKSLPEVSPEQRRAIVKLLTDHYGQLATEINLGRLIGTLPLIECDDSVFRPAYQVYPDIEVRSILGEAVHIAQGPISPFLRTVLEWLGTPTSSKPVDVVQRIQALTSAAPTPANRIIIETIFRFLVTRWQNFSPDTRQNYSALLNLAWLPGRKNSERWFKPSEVYLVFRDYLFETRAEFLAIDRPLQYLASSSEFSKFLDLQSEPEPYQVVLHLLDSSKRGRLLSREVYQYLEDNWEDASISGLVGQPCLLLTDGHYVSSSIAYWSEHPFGAHRLQLDPAWRTYYRLLTRLGVKDRVVPQDYVDVLLEIAESFDITKTPLDEATLAVVQQCWQGISNSLLDATPEFLTAVENLKNRRVIPNRKSMLIRPEHTFFEDRPGLATKFNGFLDGNVIERPQGAWQAMQVAGVRLLGQAVQVFWMENIDSNEDQPLTQRLQERLPLIGRIVESERTSFAEIQPVQRLTDLKFQRATQIIIGYQIEVFNQRRSSDPESVPALKTPDNELIVAYADGATPWSAVARELAYVLKPVGDIGSLAGGLRNALEPDDLAVAEADLNDLGYPRLQQWDFSSLQVTSNIVGVGAQDLPTSDASETAESKFGTEPQFGSSQDLSPAVTEDEVSSSSENPVVEKVESSESISARVTSTNPNLDGLPAGNVGSQTSQLESGDISTSFGKTSSTTGAFPDSSFTSNKKAGSRSSQSRGKLRSYVTQADGREKKPGDAAEAERRKAVGEAGVLRVMKYEEDHKRTPKKMDFNNEGYDIESTLADGQKWFIEVKSLTGRWALGNPAAITSAEFDFARRKREDYWLYVVEYAQDDALCRIYRIQNPAHRVDQYLYDDGWEGVSEKEVDEVE